MSPRIYVADLAAYNNGDLIGRWFDLEDTNVEILIDDVHEMLKENGHEEFAIHDYEGFGPIRISEYDNLVDVMAHVERMGNEPEKYFAYVEYNGEHYAENYDEDSVIGPWDSMEDVAYEYVENFELSEFAERYFDYEKFGRDLEIEGAFVEYDGQVYEIVD